MDARKWLAVLTAMAAAACGSSGGGASPGDGGAPSGDASVDASADASMDSSEAPPEAGVEAPPDSSADAGADGARSDADADAGPAQAIGIPMYMDPTASPGDWTQETSAAPAVALLVANPNSGPGASAAAEYTQAIATAHGAGQTIIGYVHTSYGARPIADVEADVDSWYAFYPAIDGIFYDEVSADTSTIAGYYQPIYAYVKAKTGERVVAINPGTLVDEQFMQVADIVVDFEDTYANYTNGTYPANPAWIANYPRWRFWHLVLSATSAADMQNAVTIARQRNAGYVYVTDQGPATAYSQLVTGSYWQGELAAVQAP